MRGVYHRDMQVPLLDLKLQYRSVRDEIRAALDEVLDEQQLILGKHVESFERELAEFCGVRHALGVSSGTDALLAVMMALGIGPGDEVICPSFTFFATAGSIARVGAKPVFVDIDPTTFNIDVDQIQARITPRTRAIVPVHLFGQIARIEAIHAIAQKHGLMVLEDAAQCIGALRLNKQAGHNSTAACLSFYPTKNLGALGDAGAILTNDTTLYETCRKVRVHGSGHTYYHEMIGGMFRLAAVQAAGLRVKLRRLCEWNARRVENAMLYNQLLAGSNVLTPRIDAGNFHVFHQYVVRVAQRDRVKTSLAERGVGSGVFYPLGLHLQACFAPLGYKPDDLPQTERATSEVLALPIFPELTREQIEYVARCLIEATR
jgi:dTDP-4-amino-4,6-dideoxygalactose transaminase